jgi:electron transfer flavoprotein alpha subunit
METRRAVSAQVVEIEQAEAVVCVGMGVGGAEHLPKIERLARALDAQIVATRRVVDQGWLSRHHQVGLTGKIISPRLYVGVGVRGALNHTIGIQRTGTIVGINIDPKADIFKTADFGLIGDWSEIVPAISEKLEVMAVRRAGRRW